MITSEQIAELRKIAARYSNKTLAFTKVQMNEVLDEIERLQSRVTELEAALNHIVDSGDEYTNWQWFVKIAEVALKGGEG